MHISAITKTKTKTLRKFYLAKKKKLHNKEYLFFRPHHHHLSSDTHGIFRSTRDYIMVASKEI